MVSKSIKFISLRQFRHCITSKRMLFLGQSVISFCRKLIAEKQPTDVISSTIREQQVAYLENGVSFMYAECSIPAEGTWRDPNSYGAVGCYMYGVSKKGFAFSAGH